MSKKNGPEIMYCARCQSQIRTVDLEAGRAFRVAQRAACLKCLPALMGTLAPAELKAIVEAKRPVEAPPAPLRPPSTSRLLPPSAARRPLHLWMAAGALVFLGSAGLGAWLLRGVERPLPIAVPALPPRVVARALPLPPVSIPSEGVVASAPAPLRVDPPQPPPVKAEPAAPPSLPRVDLEPEPEPEPEPVEIPIPEPKPVAVPTPLPVELPKPPAPASPPLPKPLPVKPVKGADFSRGDAAIARGLAFLQREQPNGGIEQTRNLILYTMVHAGERKGAFFQTQLEKALKAELSTTYDVALHAMTLSELNPTLYQKRLAQCAQFLVDNQTAEGGWSYGQVTTYPEYTATASKAVGTASKSMLKKKAETPAGPPKPSLLLRVKRQPLALDRKPDNSNSQYAALGLRACLESNVLPPEETLRKMKAWWEAEALDSGGWGYSALTLGRTLKPTGTMSAGALSGLVIAKHYLREPWAADPRVLKGLQWLAQSFTVDGNPGGEAFWQLYYLYGIERVGALTSLNRLGGHDWYREGSERILSMQRPDGSWTSGDKKGWNIGPAADTCFAVLFLRRATRPLEDVASVDAFVAPKR